MSGQLTEFLLRLTFEGTGTAPPTLPDPTNPSANSQQLLSYIYDTLNTQKNFKEDRSHRPSLSSDDTNQSHTPPRCNCKKSKCLKLYCECFSRGSFCQDCNCENCQNRQEFADERAKAIDEMLLKTTPGFGPRMSSGRGCNCKKTGCSKKYCECFNSGVPCTHLCKCENCKNAP